GRRGRVETFRNRQEGPVRLETDLTRSVRAEPVEAFDKLRPNGHFGISMSNIDLQALIPNNAQLGENRQLQRALEHWQPAFLNWWDEMGPSDFKAKEVYLRT